MKENCMRVTKIKHIFFSRNPPLLVIVVSWKLMTQKEKKNKIEKRNNFPKRMNCFTIFFLFTLLFGWYKEYTKNLCNRVLNFLSLKIRYPLRSPNNWSRLHFVFFSEYFLFYKTFMTFPDGLLYNRDGKMYYIFVASIIFMVYLCILTFSYIRYIIT